MRQLISLFDNLLKELQEVLFRWLDIEMGINPDAPYIGLRVEKEHDGRGRPKYVIRYDQLLFLRELRFTWTKIALLYGISRRTLYNIRSDFGLMEPDYEDFSTISDDD